MSTRTPAWLEAEAAYDDEVVGENTLSRMFEASASRHAGRDAQWYKGGIYDRSLSPDVVSAAPPGKYAALTYAELQDVVHNLAAGFRDLGVAAGTRVGIYADTRMEWAQADLGLLAAGAVVTTVYTESSPDRARFLLEDPDAAGVVVENESLLETVLEVEDDLDLEFVVVMDDYEGHGHRDDVLTLGELYERGRAAFDVEAYETWLAERDLEDLASLVYTSGTTGKPKGVRLTHRNVRTNVNGIRKRVGPRPDKPPVMPVFDETDRTLSFLPLAHVFERVAGHFLMFAAGSTVAYAESPDTVAEDIKVVQPTGASSVPRVYERIYDDMRSEAPEAVFSRAVAVAREYATADSPGAVLRLRHALYDRLVFSTVREQMGGNVEAFISGGGSLSRRLSQLFDGMGLPIYEGYGLTETSPVVSVNPPEDSRPGTLGPPLVNVDVTLDGTVVDDERQAAADGELGELLVDGPNVSPGYWNRPGATEEAFTDDGWFRSGDIIERTDDGYLVYHDRLKQLIVLDTGKNIAPQPIEDEFALSERIHQAMVVGDDRKFIAALFVPDFEAVRAWARAEGIDLPDDRAAVCRDSSVVEFIRADVEAVNETLPKSEQVTEFRLVPEEWTPDNDLMTPSMKIKRRKVEERFAAEIRDIYGEGG
ncbi:long-chain fatty acid--CoA ligase [Halobacteriales archaeon QS_1_69_70]|nr:MAG: long-chain fatty acid--CoA ligase [Halobacteriales archaeon QS_1_69_70]